MRIKLFEKKYRKTRDHDGTMEIQLHSSSTRFLFNEISGRAFKRETTYLKDENGRTIGEEVTETLNIKAIKKEVPNCVKIKINNLYINI